MASPRGSGGPGARSGLLWKHLAGLALAQQLPIADPGLQSVIEPLQAEELVGRMIILVGGREREEHGLRADRLPEDEADGNRRAHAHANAGLIVDLLKHLLRQGQARMVV